MYLILQKVNNPLIILNTNNTHNSAYKITPQLQISTINPLYRFPAIIYSLILIFWYLGSSIWRRSTSSFKKFIVSKCIWQTKIYNFDSLIIWKKKIFRFQITMYNINFIKIFNSINYLMKKSAGILFFNSFILNNIVK